MQGQAIHTALRDTFATAEFTSINNVEAWSRLDDDEESCCSSDSDSDSSSDDDSSDDDSSDDSDDSDAGSRSGSSKDECAATEIENLLADIKRQYVAPEVKPPASRPKLKAVTKRNYKQIAEETPYAMNAGTISRAQCVMCQKTRTIKSITIGDDIEVPCCVKCHTRLVVDYMAPERTVDFDAIVDRIRNDIKIPIAFKDDAFLTECPNERSSRPYNIKNKPPKAPPKQTKKRPSGGDTRAGAKKVAPESEAAGDGNIVDNDDATNDEMFN